MHTKILFPSNQSNGSDLIRCLDVLMRGHMGKKYFYTTVRVSRMDGTVLKQSDDQDPHRLRSEVITQILLY